MGDKKDKQNPSLKMIRVISIKTYAERLLTCILTNPTSCYTSKKLEKILYETDL